MTIDQVVDPKNLSPRIALEPAPYANGKQPAFDQQAERMVRAAPLGFWRGGAMCAQSINVSFDLNYGEAMAVVGESGCGKSSLMKTILGLNRPDRRRGHL
jgi:ABC-type glutathione transport system ATPase component